MHDLRFGPPVERTWVLWHAMVGLGAGMLFIPAGPPTWLVALFLITSLIVIGGVQIVNRKLVTLGLVSMAVPEVIRGIAVWRAESLGAGSQVVATFLWLILAVGAIMEAYSVKNRGIA